MAADPVQSCRERYRALQAEVGEIGFVANGTLLERTIVCGKPGCRCVGNPPHPHGPYHQLTRKLAGKTVTRRLSAAQAQQFAQWIANGRRLRHVVAAMEAVSAEAIETLLQRPSE